jgi:DNA-binding CsgD family transcriptional regulator
MPARAHAAGWLEWACATVVAGIRSRAELLELKIYERISTCVPELMLEDDAEREARTRVAISAIVDYCLDAIERGTPQMRTMPMAALERARLAAREGASVGPLLRAVEAGYQPFVGVVIAEAQRLPESVVVREHLRETYGGLLVGITAVLEREYERERAADRSALELNRAARSCGDDVPPLTRRERDVMELLLADRSYKEIAQALCVTTNTVHTHASHVYRKLGVKGRDELRRGQD